MSRRSSVSGGVAALLLVIGLFQCALALGAPWGALAWGGAHRGALPLGLRAASAAAIVLYAALLWLVLRARLSAQARRRLFSVASGFFALGALANAISRSPIERLWAPVAALLAVGFFLLRNEASSQPR